MLLDLLSLEQDDIEVRYGEMAPAVSAKLLIWLTNTVRRRREEYELLLVVGGLDGFGPDGA